MGKPPAFQFYVKDWLGDAELQMSSSSTRGIWINALCFMWESKERGKLTGSMEEMTKLLGSSNGDFTTFLDEIKRLRFGDVTVRNNLVTLINRRMYKEQKEREITRLRVQRFRCNAKSNADVTPPSSSSSSNIINKELQEPLQNKKFYYRDDHHNYVCKTCQRVFAVYENFKGHDCNEQKG